MNRFGLSLVALSALLAALLAGAIIWLIFAQPVIVIDVVSEQDITPVVRTGRTGRTPGRGGPDPPPVSLAIASALSGGRPLCRHGRPGPGVPGAAYNARRRNCTSAQPSIQANGATPVL